MRSQNYPTARHRHYYPLFTRSQKRCPIICCPTRLHFCNVTELGTELPGGHRSVIPEATPHPTCQSVLLLGFSLRQCLFCPLKQRRDSRDSTFGQHQPSSACAVAATVTPQPSFDRRRPLFTLVSVRVKTLLATAKQLLHLKHDHICHLCSVCVSLSPPMTPRTKLPPTKCQRTPTMTETSAMYSTRHGITCFPVIHPVPLPLPPFPRLIANENSILGLLITVTAPITPTVTGKYSKSLPFTSSASQLSRLLSPFHLRDRSHRNRHNQFHMMDAVRASP